LTTTPDTGVKTTTVATLAPGYTLPGMKARKASGGLLALAMVGALVAVTCGGNGGDGLTETGGAGGVNAGMTTGGGGGAGGSGAGGSGPALPPTACPVIPAIRLTNAPGASLQPAILWTGSNYFVAWGDARGGGMDIYGAMVAADGTRAGQDVLLADTAGQANSPEIAPVDGGFVVVFEDCQGTSCGVSSVLVGADGNPMGAPVVVSPPVAVQRRPYVATGLGQTYVTFRDIVDGKTMARLTTLAGGAAAGPGVVVHAPSNGQYPHVAIGPNQVALVYERDNPSAEIVLALFDAGLNMQQEVVVRSGMASPATNPVVQWNTSRWVTAWEDERSGEATIFATVVDPQGNALPAQQAYDENGNWPTIASGGAMTSLIGFYGYPGQHVMLARVEADGSLKPGQVVLDTGKFPAVAHNDQGGVRKMGEYAVVYENLELQEIMFARFECQD
jgi:hypothetical protein